MTREVDLDIEISNANSQVASIELLTGETHKPTKNTDIKIEDGWVKGYVSGKPMYMYPYTAIKKITLKNR